MRFAASHSLPLAVFLLLLCTVVSARPLFNYSQKQVLVKAYSLGGYRLAAIILQESSACTDMHSRIDVLACGCGGTHTGTADYIVGSTVSCSFLDMDWDFSIRVAAAYLAECTALFGEDGGLTCYQQGIPKARTMTKYQLFHSPYLKTIKRRIEELRHLPLDTQ